MYSGLSLYRKIGIETLTLKEIIDRTEVENLHWGQHLLDNPLLEVDSTAAYVSQYPEHTPANY